MAYSYQTRKNELFTEEGQRVFVKVRDRVLSLVAQTGAITMGDAMKMPNGIGACESWTLMACVHRMEELGDLKSVWKGPMAQHEVFIVPPSY